MSLQTNCIENIDEIKKRFDIIYAFYQKIKCRPFFLTKMYNRFDGDQKVFFAKIYHCFNKIYYETNGGLNLRKRNTSQFLIKEEFSPVIYFNNLIFYETVQSSYTNALFTKRYSSQRKPLWSFQITKHT